MGPSLESQVVYLARLRNLGDPRRVHVQRAGERRSSPPFATSPWMSWLPVDVRTYVHTTVNGPGRVQLSASNTVLPSIVMSAVSLKPGQSTPVSASLKRAKPVTVVPALPLNVWSMTVGAPAAPAVSRANFVPPPCRTCPGTDRPPVVTSGPSTK